MSILSPPGPLMVPLLPQRPFSSEQSAWPGKQHSGPSLLIPVPVPYKPAEEGMGGGNSCLYLPPQMVETPRDQFVVGGSLTPLKGVLWTQPQLFIHSLNTPFVQLWGPERNPTRYRSHVGSFLALSEHRFGGTS